MGFVLSPPVYCHEYKGLTASLNCHPERSEGSVVMGSVGADVSALIRLHLKEAY